MKADSRRGITLSDLSEQSKNFERETSLDDIAKSVAQLMVYDCLLQVTGTYAFYYAFGVIKPISSEAPKPTPEPSPPPKPTFAEGPTFTRLRIKPEQRKMLQVVYRAGKDGVTIQEIAQVLGRKTANGITSTLSALAERGCVHQLDVHSQRWYYGPRNRASA